MHTVPMWIRRLVIFDYRTRRNHIVKHIGTMIVVLFMNVRLWAIVHMMVLNGSMAPCGHKNCQDYKRELTHEQNLRGFPRLNSSSQVNRSIRRFVRFQGCVVDGEWGGTHPYDKRYPWKM